MRRLSEAEIRPEVERELQLRLPDATWAYLVSKFYVGEVIDGRMEIWELADEARRVLEAGQGFADLRRAPRRMVKPEIATDPTALPFARTQAVSLLVAESAERDFAVRIFRYQVLLDELVAREPQAVRQWIWDQQRADRDRGLTAWWLAIPVPDDRALKVGGLRIPAGSVQVPSDESPSYTGAFMAPEPPIVVDESLPGLELPSALLTWGMPGDPWEYSTPIARGGTLAELQKLSSALSAQYGWREAQATVFVLTGLVPELPALAVRLEGARRQFKGTARIVIEADPSCTPAQVAAGYRRLRRRVVGARRRNITDKHARLAAFVPLTDERTWAERMRAWNDMFPKWRYTRYQNFQRDWRQARERLLNPTYDVVLREETE